MKKQKIYIYRVTHPDHPTVTVTAEDEQRAIYQAAKGWLGRNWARAVDDAIALRIGEVKA